MIIQYVGYEPKFETRTYWFWVIDAPNKQREFTVTLNSALSKAVKYQDVPDLCFSKLKNALTLETPESPVPLQMKITDADLRKYREDHPPGKGKFSWKHRS